MKSPLVRARDGRNNCSVDRLPAQLLTEVDQQMQLAEESASLLCGETVHIEEIQNPLEDVVFGVPHEVEPGSHPMAGKLGVHLEFASVNQR